MKSSSCESKCFSIQLRFDKGQSRSILKQKGLLRSIEVYVYDILRNKNKYGSGGSKRKHGVEDINPNANKIKKGVPSEEKSRSNLDSESEFSCVPVLPGLENIKRESLSPAQINQVGVKSVPVVFPCRIFIISQLTSLF